LPIHTIVKMPNIQIGITSFVYKISTQ